MIFNPTELKLSKVVGLDLETSGLNPRTDSILLISISTAHETYVLGTNNYTATYMIELLSQLSRCEAIVAHNAKFDASFLYAKYKISFDNWYCTMLASQIMDNRPSPPSHNLLSTLDRYLGVKLAETTYKKVMQRSFIGLKKEAALSVKQYQYAGEDTKYLAELRNVQLRKAKHLDLDTIIREENRLLPVLVKMEVTGCLIDVAAWRGEINGPWQSKKDSLLKALDAELKRLSSSFPQLSGKYIRPRVTQTLTVLDLFGNHSTISNNNLGNINYDSQNQIIELFELLECTIPLNKHGKVSVDENSLKTYINENPKSPLLQFVDILLEYREFNKLLTTYGENFLEKIDRNNYIHTSYTQCRTATGRLSSHSPNLQNIPNKGIGKLLRKFFIAKTDHMFVTCDMNSAEVAIAADYSGEELLIDSLLQGHDMHSELASVSFSIIFGENFTVSKSEEPVIVGDNTFIPNDLRDAHKSVLFAKFYKAGKQRIYQVLAKYINLYHEPDDRLKIAADISAAIDKRLPKLTKYLTDKINEANTKGYLRGSVLGRLRMFDADVYGEAANFPIQNTNAEAMKIALIKIDKYLTQNDYGRIVMNIHDEVVCEVKESKTEVASAEIKKIMGDSLSYFLKTVKGGASAKINKHWEK